MLTQQRLKELLHYNPETGVFTWKVWRGDKAKVGTVAGRQAHPRKQIQIRVDNVQHGAHRLAWLYMTGCWPKQYIDHINRNSLDNRFKNLREATPSQNEYNTAAHKDSTHKIKGVTLDKLSKTWFARIQIEGRRIYLGHFKTAIDAGVAYEQAAKKHHGEFFCNTNIC